MHLVNCPYHGPRPEDALPGSPSDGICCACLRQSQGLDPTPLDPFRPVFPVLSKPPEATRVTDAPGVDLMTIMISRVTTSPIQTLAYTTTGSVVTLDELLPLIPKHIQTLEAALAGKRIIPLGPLTVLYDHPDVSDLSRYIADFAYPVPAATKLSVAATTTSPAVAVRVLPPMRVASLAFHGPWTSFSIAYAALRQFITHAKLPLGPITRECYIVPCGPHNPRSLTAIQRQLGD